MRFLLLSALLSWSLAVNAQILDVDKVKFGKISEEELTMTQYPADTSAAAVVLLDKATMKIDLTTGKNIFECTIFRHVRIKVLGNAGVDYGNFEFTLENGSGLIRESITSVKGATYNWVDGKMEEIKLPKDAIFEEKLNEYFTSHKIAFSQVKVGSVIDLEYTFTSGLFFNLPTWYFQDEIPVDYSSFTATIPNYFRYSVDMKGYASNTLVENVANEQTNGFFSLQTSGGRMENVDYTANVYRWKAVEVPALKPEPYSPRVDDYFFRVDFELASVSFPWSNTTDYSSSWENVAKNYVASSSINNYLKPKSDIIALANSWTYNTAASTDKIKLIYEKLNQGLEWNGYYSIFPDEAPIPAWEKKDVNSATANLLLLSLLRAAEIEAYPVLISTKQHGHVSMATPAFSNFNHVIVYVPELARFLDVAPKGNLWALLPVQDLNFTGLMIKNEASEWVKIEAPDKDKMATRLNLHFSSSDEMPTSSVAVMYKGYAVPTCKKNLENMENDTRRYLEDELGTTVGELSKADGLTPRAEEIRLEAPIGMEKYIVDGGERLYIPVVAVSQFPENPFKKPNRQLPIDFKLPIDHTFVTVISMEEGFQLEALPENISFSLPNQAGKYTLRFNQNPNGLQVIESLALNQTFYIGEDAEAVRQFFDLIVQAQQTQLVLVKP